MGVNTKRHASWGTILDVCLSFSSFRRSIQLQQPEGSHPYDFYHCYRLVLYFYSQCYRNETLQHILIGVWILSYVIMFESQRHYQIQSNSGFSVCRYIHFTFSPYAYTSFPAIVPHILVISASTQIEFSDYQTTMKFNLFCL